MAQGKKSTGPGGLSAESILVFVGVGLFAIIVVGLWGALKIAAAINDTRPVPNPMTALADLVKGRLMWSGAATGVLILEVVLLLGIAGGAWFLVRNQRSSVGRVDKQAFLMSKRSEIYKLTREGAQDIANRLGAGHAGPGILIGRTVRDNLEVFGSWEDMHVDIWGPRTGKTTSRAVPAILDAPGSVVATSNKRDIVDATRGPRSERGPVWVFDPQEVCEEPPNWWWNPLSYITDETKAREMAEHFVASQRKLEAQTDAFFDAAGT
ncbi:MAG TPA: type IV secretory system conjugative DNA transfer family protein, partial [Kribbella sp.]|nr:type IV secretory system conjugative DNA transfer family protein [Kribbella sp.]